MTVASQCELCKTRKLETCEVSIDTNGDLMACDVCIRAKKGCTYSNGGKGRKATGRRNTRQTMIAEETGPNQKGNRTAGKIKKRVISNEGGSSELMAVEVVVPDITSIRKARDTRQKSSPPMSPPRKKLRTEDPPQKQSSSKSTQSLCRTDSKVHRRSNSRTTSTTSARRHTSPDNTPIPSTPPARDHHSLPSPNYMSDIDDMQSK